MSARKAHQWSQTNPRETLKRLKETHILADRGHALQANIMTFYIKSNIKRIALVTRHANLQRSLQYTEVLRDKSSVHECDHWPEV